MSFPAYSAYKDSGVEWLGEVPKHWPVYSLKRTVDGCVNGLWGDEPDGENDIAVIRVADFERSFSAVGLDKLTYRSITLKEKQSRLIKSGDLLIEKSGGGERNLVGCVVLFKHEFEAITSNFVARMRPLAEFDGQFLCYAFGSLYNGRVNYPSVKQVTGIQNLDAESYLQERFCFPARAEQAQIARFLDHETARIDALIEEQQRLIGLLEEKRQAVICRAVTKGLEHEVALRDCGMEWLGKVPSHWKCLPIKRLVLLNPKKSGFSGDTAQSCSFIPMEKLRNGVVILDEECLIEEVIGGYTYFEDGDVLQAKVTPCFENGNIAVAEGLTNGIGFGSSEINVLRPYGDVSAAYIYYRLQESNYMSFCVSSMVGVGGLRRVPTSVISNFKIAVPELDEQIRIAKHLDREVGRINDLIAHSFRSVDLLKQRRSALILAAVTGKIDVRGWQPPASVASIEIAQEAV